MAQMSIHAYRENFVELTHWLHYYFLLFFFWNLKGLGPFGPFCGFIPNYSYRVFVIFIFKSFFYHFKKLENYSK